MICDKKRILYFVQLPPPVHGVSTINNLLVQSFSINKQFITKVLPIGSSRNFKELRNSNPIKIWRFLLAYFKLIYCLATFKPHVVYFSFMPVGKGFYRDFIFAKTILQFPCKLILHLHNRGIKENASKKKYLKLLKSVLNNAYVIHLSDGLLNSEIQLNNIETRKCFVVNNGISLSKIEGVYKQDKSETIHLLFLSNLLPQKGAIEVLEIFKQLNGKKNIQLHIAGSKTRDFLKAYKEFMIVNPTFEKQIHLYGMVEGNEKLKLFDLADVFLFPSSFEQECFPLVLLEAMQKKLPVVAYNIGALTEIVQHGSTGFLIKPGNTVDFVTHINKLLQNKTLRKTMGEAAYKIYLTKYTAKLFEQNMLQVFEKIMADGE